MQKEITLVDRGRGLQLSTSRITVHDLVPYFHERCRKKAAGSVRRGHPTGYQHQTASGLDFAGQARACSDWKTICSVWNLRAIASDPAEFRARRKPLSFVRFVGSFVLRFAVRQFAASLFQLPPRFTRFEPLRIVHRSLL